MKKVEDFLYGNDAEELIIRPKEIYDGALPSGNSVAALNLIRLAKITGDNNLENEVEKIFRSFAGSISSNPGSHTLALIALMFNNTATQEVVIAGSRNDSKTKEFIEIINERYLPFSSLILNDIDKEIQNISSLLANKQMLENKPTVYVCQNFTCGVPITDVSELKAILEKK